jgi:hypothetical protein
MASDYFQTKDVYRNMYFSSDNALMKRAVFPASKSVLDMELPGKAREGLEALIEESNYVLNIGEYELKILKLLDEEMQKVFKGEEDLMTALTRVDDTINVL